LSSKHVKNYSKTYLDMVSGALGPYFGRSFRYFLMDSWEAGVENWTDEMIGEFQRRRGYDPTPYLPVLTGRIIESADVSDRFLWDFRRTIADLLAENHYAAATSYFNQHRVGLYAEAMGINRFIFHTSDQQPFVDDHHKPGITLGPFGQHYTRNNTWAEQAIAWNTYLARSSYMLQQGQFVGDLAYFYGEGAPATVPFWKPVNPAPPEGYDYDWINADVLLNRISVRDGRLVLPSGMAYRALVLPSYVDQVTLPVLRKLRDLVAGGATVVAPRPIHSPSLADNAHGEEYRSIVNELWGPVDGRGASHHDYGEEQIYRAESVGEVLA